MYHKSIKEVFKELKTGEKGLSEKEAEKRLLIYGKNELKKEKKFGPLKIFLRQFSSFLVFILMIAALITFILKQFIDFGIIVAILFLNAFLGFFQEYRAEKALVKLKKFLMPEVVVVRDGKARKIRASEVVPGDIIELREGDRIMADARLFYVENLRVNEAPLTGESLPVEKSIEKLDRDASLAERKNMVYMGCSVVNGIGKGIVTATGMQTEYGKIARLVQEEKKIDLEARLDRFGKKIGMIVLVIAFLVILIGFFQGFGFFQSLFTGISLAVAAIPEGLPAVITICFAIAISRLLKSHTLVRRMASIEGLGLVSVICSDKTGTITKEELTVKKIYASEFYDVGGEGFGIKGRITKNGKEVNIEKEPVLKKILKCGLLCNNSELLRDGYIGDPTEVALIISALKAGIKKEEKILKRFSFSSERMMMSVIIEEKKEKSRKEKEKLVSYVKGAPEKIIGKSIYQLTKKGKIKLDKKRKKELLSIYRKLASEGYRVLGFAFKELEEKEKKELEKVGMERAENKLTFLGFQAMLDVPRKEVKEAIKKARQAGIDVIMVTGDSKETARAVAKEIGLGEEVIEGKEIEGMSEQQLALTLQKTKVLARIEPKQKLKIVEALQAKKEVVLMTGDGINDAPSIKKADVGVAVERGTEITKEASDLVLLDNNFASIVKAIKEGRTSFYNIKKFVNYLLSCNIAEVAVIFILSFFGLLALTPIQILWINFITDGLPAIALSSDPSPPGIMKQKPFKKKILTKKLLLLIFGIGFIMSFFLVFLFITSEKLFTLQIAQTILFTGFVFFELIRIAIIKQNEKTSIFNNKFLILAIIISLALQIFLLYSPLSIFFKTAKLNFIHWCLLLGFLVLAYFVSLCFSRKIENKIKEE